MPAHDGNGRWTQIDTNVQGLQAEQSYRRISGWLSNIHLKPTDSLVDPTDAPEQFIRRWRRCARMIKAAHGDESHPCNLRNLWIAGLFELSQRKIGQYEISINAYLRFLDARVKRIAARCPRPASTRRQIRWRCR